MFSDSIQTLQNADIIYNLLQLTHLAFIVPFHNAERLRKGIFRAFKAFFALPIPYPQKKLSTVQLVVIHNFDSYIRLITCGQLLS